MAKIKSRYVCSACGYETTRWLGRCPECDQWNTLTEEAAAPEAMEPKKIKRRPGVGAPAQTIAQIPDAAIERITTGVGELDRVLGGGAVEGSLLLIGGDPGIGKSTLLTQVSANMARDGRRVLYVSGEESARQIKMRAKRLRADADRLYILPENDMDTIEARLAEVQPDMCVIDSIQTMYRSDMATAPGSVSQVREAASQLMRYAKVNGTTIFLVGHVTKDGSLAGPRVLEHMVDAVLYFEGDQHNQYRLLRAVKNRFGSVNELGMFEMTGEGMMEVPGASEALLSERALGQSGSVVFCAMEGSRPVLADVQALVASTVFGNPRRMTSGVEQGRLALLLAVLEKRAGLPLFNQDVYVNIAAGMELTEPAADLALCAAVASSARNIVIPQRMCVLGEVGLAGEVRAVAQVSRRIQECARLGFDTLILPKGNLRALPANDSMRLIGVATVSEMLGAIH